MVHPSTDEPEATTLSWRTILVWFAVYAVIGGLSLYVLQHAISAVIPVWLPAGIVCALQLRAAPRQRLPLAVANFVLELVVEVVFGKYPDIWLHVAYAAAVAFESYAAARLVARLTGGRLLRLDVVKDLSVFLAASVIATAVAGALAAVAEVRMLPNPDPYLQVVAAWVQADLVAFVVLTPLVLASLDGVGASITGKRLHALALALTLVASTLLLFGSAIKHDSPLVALTFLLFPLLIWAALAFGVEGAAAGSVLLSIVVGLLTEKNLGPIAALGLDAFPRQVIAQGFVGLLGFSALTLGVLTRQQRATQKRLEGALHGAEEAAERFRSFFEGTPEMLAAVDGDSRVVLANRRWMDEFSAYYNQENVIGLHVEALAAGAGDEAADTVDWWRRALAGEAIVTPWSVSHWDGSTSTYEMSLAPLRDPAGRVIGAYMAVRDVADLRVRQEEESRARRLETVGRLAGGVAHDFNNIVTGMQGYAELLSESLPLDHPGRDDLEEIRKAGDRAAALTRQLLAYARRQLIEPRQVHLPELLPGLTGLLRRVIGESIALNVDVPGDAWPVHADPGQLEQVIMNLVVNARDAMPSGGRIIIECENVTVRGADATARDLTPGDYVAISVTDTGEGMSSDVLEKVFEPFYTTKPQGKGTGLGLATVDGIARQLGGSISANSIVGLGSTLRVFLPRDAGPATGTPPIAAAAPTRLKGTEHILVVEDDAALRSLTLRILEQCGFSVESFADGAAALEIDDASLARAALLVCDVVLPGLSGREVADRLRDRAPHLAVLYVSGYTVEAVAGHGVRDENIHFLQKPFTPELLASTVRTLLDANA